MHGSLSFGIVLLRAAWLLRDPIEQLRRQLEAEGRPADRLEAAAREAGERIEEAYRKAEAAPVAPPETATQGALAPGN